MQETLYALKLAEDTFFFFLKKRKAVSIFLETWHEICTVSPLTVNREMRFMATKELQITMECYSLQAD